MLDRIENTLKQWREGLLTDEEAERDIILEAVFYSHDPSNYTSYGMRKVLK